MNEEKGLGEEATNEEEAPETEDNSSSGAASRARNRTVMLTPEMTGQVRALLKGDAQAPANESSFGSEFLPPSVDWQPPPAPEDNGALGENGSLDAQSEAPAPVTGGETVAVSREAMGLPGIGEELGAYDPMTSLVPPMGQGISAERSTGAAMFATETPPPAPSANTAVIQAPSQGVAPAISVNPGAGGAASTGAPRAPRAPVQASSIWNRGNSKIVGFLISYDKEENGEVLPIRSGRWLITSRPTDHGEFILIDDETVSPLHAILRATKEGKMQVLDQLSEHGTGVYRAGEEDEIEVAGGLEDLDHGDTVRFGDRYFLICLVPESMRTEEE